MDIKSLTFSKIYELFKSEHTLEDIKKAIDIMNSLNTKVNKKDFKQILYNIRNNKKHKITKYFK